METHIVNQAMTLIRARKFEEARELLLPAAETGEPESQALLGQIYNAGWVCRWIMNQLLNGGHARLRVEVAMVNGGWVCFMTTGKGFLGFQKAATWWKKAVENGILKPRSVWPLL